MAPAGGTGAKLTISAGNTLVFQDAGDYMLINRGSQVIANGSPTAPIVLTSYTDAPHTPPACTAGREGLPSWLAQTRSPA